VVREFRRFPLATSGVEWLLNHGIEDDEQLIGIAAGGRPWLGAGTGPSRNGYTGDGLFWPYRTPRVIATGSSADCAAAVAAERIGAGIEPGLWVLTDQRFARIRFEPELAPDRRKREVQFHHGIEFQLDQHFGMEPEPVACVSQLEIESSRLRHDTGCVRRLPMRFRQPRVLVYRRLTMADGSGFDIIDTDAHPEYR